MEKLKTMIRRLPLNFMRSSSLRLRYLLSEKNSRQGEAFIVTGSGRTGTRMLTRFLIGCGCEGNGYHNQLFDYINPDRGVKKIVWRRHAPFKGGNGSLILLIKLVTKLGYTPIILWIKRERESHIKSLMNNFGLISKKAVEKRIDEEAREIGGIIKKMEIKYIEVSYEDFTTSTNYRKDLAKKLELRYIELEDYKNMNKQYQK